MSREKSCGGRSWSGGRAHSRGCGWRGRRSLRRDHHDYHGRLTALLFAAALILLTGCQSLTGPGAARPGGSDEDRLAAQLQRSAGDGSLNGIQAKLVEGAHSIRGRTRLVIGGRRFNADCTGTVLAIYWHAGIDLASPMARYRGNGVTRLYRFLEEEQALYSTRRPAPGDLIFWDNTYDRNNDGQPNDYLTHTGMVVAVEEDGTVHYVHHNYRKGVVFARMNLYKPGVYTEVIDGEQRIINSPMRMRGSPSYDKWLASQLTRSFGRAWEAVDASAFLGG